MLRTILTSVLVLISAQSSNGLPKSDDFALGAMIGTMGSATLKYYVVPEHSILFGVEFMDEPWSVFYADYNMNFREVYGTSSWAKQIMSYWSLGVGAGFWTRKEHCGRWHCKWEAKSTGAGNGFLARLMIGNEWFPRKKPFSAFLEFGPTYMMYPSNGNTFEAAVGGRFYF